MRAAWAAVNSASLMLPFLSASISRTVVTAACGVCGTESIDEVLVPTEDVIEMRRGKKVQAERKFMPGYVLVHMEMSNRGYHLISSINRVTGFLGPQGKPMPMRDSEVNAILNRVETGDQQPRNLIRFEIGEKIVKRHAPSGSGGGPPDAARAPRGG